MERAYESPPTGSRELTHAYGQGVHVLGDPYALGMLAKLCSPETTQPAFNEIVRALYRHLMVPVCNEELPRTLVETPTRMAEKHPGACFRGVVVDPKSDLVVVDVARAGMLPALVCYEMANRLLDPARVRQDHVVMARTTDAAGAVTGADIYGGKIGGSIDGATVLLPDPMGATGSSVATVLEHYLERYGAAPAKLVCMHLIVTPRYIRTLKERFEDVVIYTLRVDRGLSDEEVLSSALGARWSEECGLDDTQYIVPGGGGFGELMNNSWV